MANGKTAEFWKKLEPGCHFVLSDIVSIKDSVNSKSETPGSMTYKAKSLLSVRERRGLAEWILFDLESSVRELMLVVKMVDSEVDLKLLSPQLFSSGSRAETIAEYQPLFEDVPGGTDPMKVRFAREIQHDVSGSEPVVYSQKFGELSGEGKLLPERSGLGKLLVTLVEYGATNDSAESEMLIVESGEVNSDGSEIKLLIGAPISDRDCVVLEEVS